MVMIPNLYVVGSSNAAPKNLNENSRGNVQRGRNHRTLRRFVQHEHLVLQAAGSSAGNTFERRRVQGESTAVRARSEIRTGDMVFN